MLSGAAPFLALLLSSFLSCVYLDLSARRCIIGVASQEVVKLVTHQYVPANNTLIYNGMAGDTTTLTV